MRSFLLFLMCALSVSAAGKDFSSWTKYSKAELVMETSAFAPGAIGAAGLKLTMVKDWHTYWVNPGDSGSPIRLKFKTGPGLKIRQVYFPLPKREQSGPLISFAYDGVVILPIELDVNPNARVASSTFLDVDAEWLVCADVCIPANQKLHLDIPIARLESVEPSADFEIFQKMRALIPRPVADFPRFQFHEGEASLTLPSQYASESFVDFFPFRGSGVTNVKAQNVNGVLQFEKSNVGPLGDQRVGVLALRSKKTGKLMPIQFGDDGWNFATERGATPEGGLLWMLLCAFLGGLILNLMPCVFPILSIKLLSLLKHAQSHKKQVRAENLAYVAGVLISFLLIAVVLSLLRSAGNLVGWGFQLQSPIFLALLCWLFFALSLNLLGVYEFELLGANVGHRLTRLGGIGGSFFTGVLAVIVSSPCTAPFMGVALGFGLSQPVPWLVAIFFLLGLGLAFPYLLFAIFPKIVRVFPKPGAWMTVVKQVMAFPLLLTTLWLLWILGQIGGTNSILAVLAGSVALGFALWLSEWRRRLAQVVTVVLLAGALIFVNSSQSRPAGERTMAEGLWQPYSDAKLEELKGKNVFVNMTADWCLTCKVNERLVFDDRDVQDTIKKKGVVLLKGDWTQRNEEITRFLNRYDRVGVPFYVLYSNRMPAGQTLPEVLTKSGFLDFLERAYPGP